MARSFQQYWESFQHSAANWHTHQELDGWLTSFLASPTDDELKPFAALSSTGWQDLLAYGVAHRVVCGTASSVWQAVGELSQMARVRVHLGDPLVLNVFGHFHLADDQVALRSLAAGLGDGEVDAIHGFRHPFVLALPALPFRAEEMALVVTYLERGQGDLFFSDALESTMFWAERYPTTAQELIRTYLDQPESLPETFLAPLLTGVARDDWHAAERIRIELDARPGLVHTRLWADVNLAKLELIAWTDALSVIKTYLADVDEANVAIALSALSKLARAIPDCEAECLTLLHQVLAERPGPGVWFPASQWLFFDNRVARPFLQYFVSVPPDEGRTLDDLDTVLLAVGREEPEAILDFLEAWSLAHPSAPKLGKVFKSSLSALRGKATLVARMTRWLAGPRPLARQAVAVMESNHIDHLAAPELRRQHATQLDLLVWRITRGGTLSAERQAALLRAILAAAPKALPLDGVEAELRHFAWNYPGSAREVLLRDVAALPAKTRGLGERLLAYLDRYEAARAARPKLKELRGNPERVRQFQRLHERMMAEAMDEAQRQSIFVQLGVVTMSSVARGEGWINRIGDQFTEPGSFGTFEHAIEVPRGELIDPDAEAMRKMELIAREREATS